MKFTPPDVFARGIADYDQKLAVARDWFRTEIEKEGGHIAMIRLVDLAEKLRDEADSVPLQNIGTLAVVMLVQLLIEYRQTKEGSS